MRNGNAASAARQEITKRATTLTIASAGVGAYRCAVQTDRSVSPRIITLA